ncbi:hypothetical protein LTR91_011678 [Friedmanniomyces endolithicus]|uniref:Methyltransferase domain-containing protein n=2 Tax=Friedmanniomyces endolithicus TaxID=329885 RepID=A0AAN6KH10_9PEZI|nr:hypothetical protein LTR94_003540 [Friedmanniomyces endolithicus]KAK0778698.1 hypothetical protein LTR59_013435 [Friedmanniomyces endolithicus]KAK0791531.1 hypothetical protein LTR75_011721 [Friedmanniomyces endolithicus]KAK0839047.1 hypothetical protein LTR03_011532 [Friedmanniomyces endolithicus]KAK0858405.1 hypothetical protein LTS02_009836 [Friedmanniomyces endolithicus]
MDNDILSSPEYASRREEYKKRFYIPVLELSESTKELLVEYSKIPEGQLQAHVERIREKAWAIYPYPCIGMGRFLNLHISTHPLYHSSILPRLLTGTQVYLDLGCAFAQNLRRLVFDGVPSAQCYGADLRLEFLDLGYELFADRATLESKFIAADVFDEESGLRELDGKVDIVDASSFFHLFTLAEQKKVARRVLGLLKPRAGSLVVGRQVGNSRPGEYGMRSGEGTRYRHDVASWRGMWEEVGGEKGVEFEVWGELRKVEGFGGRENAGEVEGEGAGMMEFWVRRLH